MKIAEELPLSQAGLEEAYALLKEGHFEDAIENFTECLSEFPNEAGAYQGRALAHFQLKNWPSANSDFSKAMTLNPRDLENWVGYGMSLAMANEIYKAIDVFQTLLEQNPNYVRGRIQLGLLYYRLCLVSKGTEQMDLALASRPSLIERRTIEKFKAEQKQLDKKRYYKPDFEALHREQKLFPGDGWIKKAVKLLKKRNDS